jgi:hypothetical protein
MEQSGEILMAIPLEMSKHLNEWVGTFPSAWWIYLRLRLRGYLSSGASGAAVRRIIREAIRGEERSRREQLDHGLHLPGASWNTRVPGRLLEENLLSSRGEQMARWVPEWRR